MTISSKKRSIMDVLRSGGTFIPCLTILCAVIFLSSPAAAGTTYYVATTGADANFGLHSCSAAFPCRWIGSLISYNWWGDFTTKAGPGDTIIVHAGTYRESFYAGITGTIGNPVTVQAYGDGEVIVDSSTCIDLLAGSVGSTQANPCPALWSFSLDSGSIYKTAALDFVVGGVVEDDTPMQPAYSIQSPIPRSAATISSNQYFQDLNTGILYVYGNPSGHDIVVVSANRVGISNGASINGFHAGSGTYTVIDGLTFRGAPNYGIHLNDSAGAADNMTVKNSTAKYNNWTGIGGAASYSTFQNNIVHHNMYNNWPRGRCNGGAMGLGTASDENSNQVAGGTVVAAALGGGVATFTRSVTNSSWTTNGLTTGRYIQFGLKDGTTGLFTVGGAFAASNNNKPYLITNVTATVVTVSDPGNLITSQTSGSSTFYVADNTVPYLHCYGSSGSGGWGAGLSVPGGHGTYTGNTVYTNGGEGLLNYFSAGNNLITGNTVHDNWSINIYIDNEPADVITRNFSYCTLPAYTADPGQTQQGSLGGYNEAVAQRNRPMGVGTSDEYYDGTTHLANFKITDNVIVGCRNGIEHSPDVTGSGWKGATIANNVVISPNVDCPAELSYICPAIRVSNNSGNNTGTIIKNNIFIGQNTSPALWDIEASAPTGITLDYNNYYQTALSNTVSLNSNTALNTSCAAWSVDTGATHDQCGGNIYGVNPVLVNLTSLTPATDKALNAGSGAAYHTGLSISGLTVDYSGNAWSTPPSMGAFEFGGAGPTVTSCTLSPSSATKGTGQTQAATATCMYSDGSGPTSCTSDLGLGTSNAGIASVSGQTVTAVSAGSATITGTTISNSTVCTPTMAVTVTSPTTSGSSTGSWTGMRK